MKFKAEVKIMPLKELLDPQGKAVLSGLKHMDISSVKDVRIGKHILLELEAANEKSANEIVDDACKKLLANPVMEHYEFSLHEAGK
jgi:phosphoribosylformylglycinamidine synthase